jgi:hypothetical protein
MHTGASGRFLRKRPELRILLKDDVPQCELSAAASPASPFKLCPFLSRVQMKSLAE